MKKKNPDLHLPGMDVPALVKILNACQTSGVSLFRLGDLHIEFGPKEAASLPLSPKDIQREIEREIAADEDLRDLHLQNLMLENPEAYENEMRKVEYAEIRERTERDVQTLGKRPAESFRRDSE